MSNKKSEDIWRLMSEYKLKVLSNSVQKDMLCIICSTLMIDPHNSVCGCRYCRKCITEYSKNSDKCCPGDNVACKELNIKFALDVREDRRMNNKIFALVVHCPRACGAKVVLSQMQGHLDQCEMKCPYQMIGCDNEEETDVLAHIESSSLSHAQILLKYIDHIKEEVDQMSSIKEQIAKLKRSNDELRDKMREMSEQNERNLSCSEDQITKLKEANNEQRMEIQDLKNEMNEQTNEVMKLKEEVSKSFKEYIYQKDKWQNEYQDLPELKEEMAKQREDYQNHKDDTEKKYQEIIELKDKMAMQMEEYLNQKDDAQKKYQEITESKEDLARQMREFIKQRDEWQKEYQEITELKEDVVKQIREYPNQNGEAQTKRNEIRELNEEKAVDAEEITILEAENLMEICSKEMTKEKNESVVLNNKIFENEQTIEKYDECENEEKETLPGENKKIELVISELMELGNETFDPRPEIMGTLDPMPEVMQTIEESEDEIQQATESNKDIVEQKKHSYENKTKDPSLLVKNESTSPKLRRRKGKKQGGSMRHKTLDRYSFIEKRSSVGELNLDEISTELGPKIDFIWRINGITQKTESMNVEGMFSEPFYSNRYKFCLWIYRKIKARIPGVVDTMTNSDMIHVYCVLMKGENDDDVEWPMTLPVTLTVINPSDIKKSKSTAHRYSQNLNKHERMKPNSGRNPGGIGSGLLPYSTMANFIMQDSISIACKVGHE